MSTVGILLRQRERRDRVTVSIWVLATALLAVASAVGVAREYGDDADREAILRLAVQNPAILLLRGLPQGASLDQFIFFQIFTYLALLASLMSTFLAVRHSRAEEETGRAELVEATPASRVAPMVATLIHGALANLALGLLVALAFIAAGLAPAGSLLTGLAAAATGVAFLGVALLAAQFVTSSRAANSIGVTLVLTTFVLRGIGDALGTPAPDGLHMTSAWPSWLSPIGWGQHVDAYGSNTPLPLLLSLGLALISTGAALRVQFLRDVGASLLPSRAGRATARRSLSGNLALAFRLQSTTIVGWAAGGAACGLFAGSLSGLVRQAAESTPAVGDSLEAIAGSGTSLDQALISVMFSIAGLLAAACAIQAVIRVRQEEAGGTAELLLATPLSRVRWLADYLLVGLIAILGVLGTAAIVAVLAIIGSDSDRYLVGDTVTVAVAQLPAALLFLGLLAVIFTIVPSLTAALGWALLGAAGFVGIFGPLVGLPESVTNISPFANTPDVFSTDVDWTGGFWMLALALAAVAASMVLMRRRALRGA